MSASASAAGTSNSLLVALSQPTGLNRVEFDIRKGRLVLVIAGGNNFPGLFSSKTDKAEHLIKIATQVQELVDREVTAGNPSGLQLGNIYTNLEVARQNLLGRVKLHAPASRSFTAALKEIMGTKDTTIVASFGDATDTDLSSSERRLIKSIRNVDTQFQLTQAKLQDLLNPRATQAALASASTPNGFATALHAFKNDAHLVKALQAKRSQLVAAGNTPGVEKVDAILDCNNRGAGPLQQLAQSMRHDIAGAFGLYANVNNEQAVKTASADALHTFNQTETEPAIKQQIEYLIIVLRLLEKKGASAEAGSHLSVPAGAGAAAVASAASTAPAAADPFAAALAGHEPPTISLTERVGNSALARQSWGGAAIRVAAYYAGSSALSAVWGSLTAETAASAASTVGSAIPGVSTLATYGPPIAFALAPSIINSYQNRKQAPAPAAPATATAAVQPGIFGRLRAATAAVQPDIFGRLGAAYGAAKTAFTTGAVGAPASAAAPPPNVMPAGSPPAATALAGIDASGYGSLPAPAVDLAATDAAATSVKGVGFADVVVTKSEDGSISVVPMKRKDGGPKPVRLSREERAARAATTAATDAAVPAAAASANETILAHLTAGEEPDLFDRADARIAQMAELATNAELASNRAREAADAQSAAAHAHQAKDLNLRLQQLRAQASATPRTPSISTVALGTDPLVGNVVLGTDPLAGDLEARLDALKAD